MSVFTPDDFDDYDYYDELDDLDDLGAGLPPDDGYDDRFERKAAGNRRISGKRKNSGTNGSCSGGCCGIFLWIAIIVIAVMLIKACIGG